MKDRIYIGIDLGGTNIAAGIVSTCGNIIAKKSTPTLKERDISEIVSDMADLTKALVFENGYSLSDIKAVGIGCPGTIDFKTGEAVYSNNIKAEHFPLTQEFKKHIDVTVKVDNDANCAALGEYLAHGQSVKSFLFITLGTGVGGGIILNGEIYRGMNGAAGELGHITLVSGGDMCTCGKEGCLEAYASATGLINQTASAMKNNPDSLMHKIARENGKISGKTAFEAAKAGDAAAGKVVSQYIRYIADGIVSFENIFQPDIIAIGGGISKEGDYILAPIKEYVNKTGFNKFKKKSKLVIAKLHNDAGIIGAAGLVMPKQPKKKELVFLKPILKEMIWGGSRLSEFGYTLPSNKIGECWAISAHSNGDCTVCGGSYDGITLSVLWKNHKELFGKCKSNCFPLLVKIIDANDDLSIQVHPNDIYAAKHENGSLGKTECWYVLDCKENSTIIIGHNAKDKTELKKMIESGRWSELIREIPIKKGDFFQINPGCLHAIKSGTLILETQQNSDITYRAYDYGRLQNNKPRELHINKSLDVIEAPFTESEINPDITVYGNLKCENLISCEFYCVKKIDVSGNAELAQPYNFMNVSIIEGTGVIDNISIKKGDNFIIPYNYGTASITGYLSMIISYII